MCEYCCGLKRFAVGRFVAVGGVLGGREGSPMTEPQAGGSRCDNSFGARISWPWSSGRRWLVAAFGREIVRQYAALRRRSVGSRTWQVLLLPWFWVVGSLSFLALGRADDWGAAHHYLEILSRRVLAWCQVKIFGIVFIPGTARRAMVVWNSPDVSDLGRIMDWMLVMFDSSSVFELVLPRWQAVGQPVSRSALRSTCKRPRMFAWLASSARTGMDDDKCVVVYRRANLSISDVQPLKQGNFA
jgi:hypothetical protein